MVVQKCRICLNEGAFKSIFSINGGLMISTKIMSIANITIYPNDGLPSTICSKCIERLENCIEFAEQCEKSDLHLRSASIDIGKVVTVKEDDKSTSKIFENCDKSVCLEETNNYKINNRIIHKLVKNEELSADSKPPENVWINTEKFVSTNNKTDPTVTKKSQKQQCFTCGKVMSSKFRLKTHLHTHTGERPFTCPHCSKNFSLAQNLKVHLRIHTGEKPFRCSVCEETFAHSSGLAVHKRKHTGQKPYQCILCPQSFRTVGHLQYHIRKHTGAKNFECSTCGRAFITQSDLKQHLVTHSGEKAHVCCICGMRMTRASHLKRHILIVHKAEKKMLSQNHSKQELNQDNEDANDNINPSEIT